MSDPIRVLIADDQALLRGSFRMLVDSDPGLTAVGEAEDGLTAVDLARTHRPDVVLMDIRMPRMDGVEAASVILGDPATAGTRIIMLTMFDHDSYVFAALRAGASGFLLKDVTPNDLLRAIHVVAEGESLLAPSVTRRLIAEFCRTPSGPPQEPPPRITGLTAREQEVLTLVTLGRTNAEIAAELHLSSATVKTHIAHLFRKLRARDRVQLVITGYHHGLVEPGQVHRSS
ncbi:response regulator [Streptoalloteichus hindustanus]|uniref:Two component transcriptional regulator, LuxR family n=1 Tax=Streptoalloteichus hindustanus TaxID=2017 RepID=A0A1M5D386_STRHI|nr:response regulator transcription factor [Streptoalloteichus hindustanus]SHF61262.1 two component transcriptional regulator, LuxR family [Streptoalloteichus hindustanus]